MSDNIYEPLYEIERLIGQELVSPHRRRPSGKKKQEVNNRAIRSFKPRMDLHEDKVNNLITAIFDFPGIVRDDVYINMQAGKLTVSADTKNHPDLDERGYMVRERRAGKLSRTLQLPQGVLNDQINASMQDGLLTVTFPQMSAEQAPKRIFVN